MFNKFKRDIRQSIDSDAVKKDVKSLNHGKLNSLYVDVSGRRVISPVHTKKEDVETTLKIIKRQYETAVEIMDFISG